MADSFKKQNYSWIVRKGDTPELCSFLSEKSGLSKTKLKKALSSGAVWLKRGSSRKRVRRVSYGLKPGACVELYYDPQILEKHPPSARCLCDNEVYSVWYKPEGLLTQGTMYSDHCSLIRQVELFFKSRRQVFPVHRLDRETYGVLVVAHKKDAAATLSGLFKSRDVTKHYRAEVLGNLENTRGNSGIISEPIEGKEAVTHYTVLSFDPAIDTTCVDIHISTGRRHQIRRHFEGIGHPVMGDPVYGDGNKNRNGLQLCSVSIGFDCPYQKKKVEFSLDLKPGMKTMPASG